MALYICPTHLRTYFIVLKGALSSPGHVVRRLSCLQRTFGSGFASLHRPPAESNSPSPPPPFSPIGKFAPRLPLSLLHPPTNSRRIDGRFWRAGARAGVAATRIGCLQVGVWLQVCERRERIAIRFGGKRGAN